MSFALTYSDRLLLFLAFCAAVVLGDFIYHGRRAARYREYGFLLFGGVCGAVFGLLNDQLTSRISAEYFIYGKGLPQGETFEREVVRLGLMAGFSAGVPVAGFLLLANSLFKARERLPIVALVPYLLRVGLFAIVMACLLGCAAQLAPRQFLQDALGDTIEPAAVHRFTTVWGIHIWVCSLE